MAASKILTNARYIGKVCESHPEYEGLRQRTNSRCVECASESKLKCDASPKGIATNAARNNKPENKIKHNAASAKSKEKPEVKEKNKKTLAIYRQKPESIARRAELRATPDAREKQREYDSKRRAPLEEKEGQRKYDAERSKTSEANAKAKRKEYNNTPEAKAKRKEYSNKPEVKDKAANKRNTPEHKLHTKELDIARTSTAVGRAYANKKALSRRKCKAFASINYGPEDDAYIVEYFQICIDFNENTGEPHNVDHVVAMGNHSAESGVCGLDVGCNMRVIQAKQNISKGSKSYICKAEQWQEFGYYEFNPRLSDDSPTW